MKQEVKSYIIVCDCCGEHFHDGNDHCCYIDDTDGSIIESEAESSEWLTIGDKHYCPNCYSINDDDNYVTKDGHIYDGENYEEIK